MRLADYVEAVGDQPTKTAREHGVGKKIPGKIKKFRKG